MIVNRNHHLWYKLIRMSDVLFETELLRDEMSDLARLMQALLWQVGVSVLCECSKLKIS